MGKQILIYNNQINMEGFGLDTRREYFAIPIIPIKVALKYDSKPAFNHFERAVLTLLLSGNSYSIDELSEKLILDNELIELIVNTLTDNGYLDKRRCVTQKGESALKEIHSESIVVVKYAFYDLNREQLLKETIAPNKITFKTLPAFAPYSDYNSNKIQDYYRNFVITSDSNDSKINFSVIDLGKSKKIDSKQIESMLNRENIKSNDPEEKVLISASIIEEIKSNKHYLLSYVDTYIYRANTNRWDVKNPVTLNGDLELQSFFYFNNNNKIVSLIIERLMKQRTELINDRFDNKELINFIRNKLFTTPIAKKHELFIEPLMFVLDSIIVKDSTESGQSGNLQVQETIKMALIYFGQLFESLFYQTAIEYNSGKLDELINILTKHSDSNMAILSEIARYIGFDCSDTDNLLFRIKKNDLELMFKLGKEYVLTACVSMNVLIANRDDAFFFNSLAKKHPDLINKLQRLKRIRDEKRHTTDREEEVSIKDYLDIVFDVMELAFGYKVNQTLLDEFFNSKVSVYDYSYSYEYIRNRVGTNFFESLESKVQNIKNHLIEMHKKCIERQSSYLASAHSIIEDLYKEMLNTILSKDNIKLEFSLKDYFKDSLELEQYINEIGFETKIEKELFDTEVNRALFIESSTENRIKQGFEDRFSKATNRVKMQALIVLFRLNNNLIADYLTAQDSLKELFKLTTIVMYLDRSHKQSNKYDDKHATYIVNEILNLVKCVYNNKKIINWR